MILFIGEVQYQKRIKDMKFGDDGYTVPWAYDPKSNELDLNYPIYDGCQGTVQMRVRCIGRGNYTLTGARDYKY